MVAHNRKAHLTLQTLALFLPTPPYWSFPSSGPCWPVVKEQIPPFAWPDCSLPSSTLMPMPEILPVL